MSKKSLGGPTIDTFTLPTDVRSQCSDSQAGVSNTSEFREFLKDLVKSRLVSKENISTPIFRPGRDVAPNRLLLFGRRIVRYPVVIYYLL